MKRARRDGRAHYSTVLCTVAINSAERCGALHCHNKDTGFLFIVNGKDPARWRGPELGSTKQGIAMRGAALRGGLPLWGQELFCGCFGRSRFRSESLRTVLERREDLE